jgi:hypothetical protein
MLDEINIMRKLIITLRKRLMVTTSFIYFSSLYHSGVSQDIANLRITFLERSSQRGRWNLPLIMDGCHLCVPPLPGIAELQLGIHHAVTFPTTLE